MTAVAALAAALLLAPVASAVDKVNTKQLRKLVTVDGIMEHERALQDIAIANDGNRAAGTSGNVVRRTPSPRNSLWVSSLIVRYVRSAPSSSSSSAK